jgi:hypothetical protein
MKAFGYTTVDGNTEMELIDNVNDNIKEGWQPIGGIAVTSVITDTELGLTEEHFYQAMILEEDK